MTAKHVLQKPNKSALNPQYLEGLKPLNTQKEVLLSSLQSLSHWLGSDITQGQLIEWGMPLRLNLRNIILSFLAPYPNLCLWVNADLSRSVYPPAWAAKHIDLNNLYFIQCADPIRRLRPLFFDSTFKFIILDSPDKLFNSQMAFLSQALRQNQMALFILRPYYLNKNRGNPFAKKRINTFFNTDQKIYTLKSIKGAQPTQLNIDQKELYESFSKF